MFFSTSQGFGNSTPLSPAEESGADEKLTLFNQIFLPPLSFFSDVCLRLLFASIRALPSSAGKRAL